MCRKIGIDKKKEEETNREMDEINAESFHFPVDEFFKKVSFNFQKLLLNLKNKLSWPLFFFFLNSLERERK